ncbi:MAG: hypothetical protein Greene07144_921 [Parcubacteria group bacterium Greene0714_4]|nr:MAG: hypothetical protein Greene07144_921 [Parcubacteria group bacterium Greene0714_4]
MFLNSRTKAICLTALVATLVALGTVAYANHSWGPYHWARAANPFTLKLGDNVGTIWDGHLAFASTDWSASSTLDTTVVAGQARANCRATKGRVEVCNKTYGFNGWLGVASIWINSTNHITQGTVKLNDTYFNTATYNTPAWRQFVMCQEVGHTFGLDHQNEIFGNTNLGSCMDYTNDPSGVLYSQLSNEHPNVHDYGQLDLMYAHLDSGTTVGQAITNNNGKSEVDDDVDNTGRRHTRHERDLGNGGCAF